jgi:hypothetical protein
MRDRNRLDGKKKYFLVSDGNQILIPQPSNATYLPWLNWSTVMDCMEGLRKTRKSLSPKLKPASHKEDRPWWRIQWRVKPSVETRNWAEKDDRSGGRWRCGCCVNATGDETPGVGGWFESACTEVINRPRDWTEWLSGERVTSHRGCVRLFREPLDRNPESK